jgi:hypothetical protein
MIEMWSPSFHSRPRKLKDVFFEVVCPISLDIVLNSETGLFDAFPSNFYFNLLAAFDQN